MVAETPVLFRVLIILKFAALSKDLWKYTQIPVCFIINEAYSSVLLEYHMPFVTFWSDIPCIVILYETLKVPDDGAGKAP